MDAFDVMDSLRVNDLISIAKLAGISKAITRKPELIAALDRFLKTDLAGFVDRLGTIERYLFAEAVHNHDRVSPVVFEAKYNTACPSPRGQRNGTSSSAAPCAYGCDNAAEILNERTSEANKRP